MVKNGEGATLVVSSDGSESHPVVKVPSFVGATAAGVSFNGGFLANHCVSNGIARTVKTAQTYSGKVVGAKGALVPFELFSG